MVSSMLPAPGFLFQIFPILSACLSHIFLFTSHSRSFTTVCSNGHQTFLQFSLDNIHFSFWFACPLVFPYCHLLLCPAPFMGRYLMPFIQCHSTDEKTILKYSTPLTIATLFTHSLSCLNPIQWSWSFVLLAKYTAAKVGKQMMSI